MACGEGSFEVDLSAVDVYVPADAQDAAGILPGSGIVGSVEGPVLVVDFEGDRYGRHPQRTWADQVHHAWGRHQSRYPTIARRTVEPARLVRVGRYDPREGLIELDGPPAQMPLIQAWLGRVPTDADRATSEDMAHSERRNLRAMLAGSAQHRTQAEWFIRQMRAEHLDLLGD